MVNHKVVIGGLCGEFKYNLFLLKHSQCEKTLLLPLALDIGLVYKGLFTRNQQSAIEHVLRDIEHVSLIDLVCSFQLQ